MDAATINARIYAGRGKAAQRIGYSFDVHRPAVAASPLPAPLTTIHAAFNAADNTYAKPNLYGKPVWFADLDGRLVQPGDYLVRTDAPTDVYFIAGMQSLLPIIAIDCPRTVKITSPTLVTGVGAVGYSGICDDGGSVSYLLGDASTGWPCSIVLGRSGQSTKTNLPSSSSKESGWQILLPPSVPVRIDAGMRILDDLDRKYDVIAAELTDLGWRIMAHENHL